MKNTDPRRRAPSGSAFKRFAGASMLLGALASTARAQQWEELGPAPTSVSGGSAGRIAAIACSATDPDLYYVGAADGGVWRTTDGGLTWTPLTDTAPTSAIGALAIDPFNAQIIYAGTGEANFANHSRFGLGLMRSMDGGQTWSLFGQSLFAGRCFSKIVCDPINAGVLYAGTTIAGGFPSLAAAKGHPMATGPVGAWRSTDHGQTWQQLTGLPTLSVTDIAIDPSNPSIVYAAVGHIFGDARNGLYKSSDAGQTWTKLGGGLPAAPGRISVAVAPSSPQVVYALVANPSDAGGGGATNVGAFRSTNGGTSWSGAGGVGQSSYGWYLNVVSVKPDDPNTAFYGGLDITRRAGSTSTTVTAPHVDNHAMAWDAAGRFLVGDDGGLHRSTNLGASWTNLNVGLGTIQYYAGFSTHPTDDEWFIGGMQDNGSSRRSGGLAWTHVTGGDGGWTQVIDTGATPIVFTESQGTGSLYRSTNGGLSFSGAGNGLSGNNCFLPPYVRDPSNTQRLLYATDRVFVSTNGGTQWTPLSPSLVATSGAAIRALQIAPSDPAYVYAATNDGRVLVSQDGGSNFDLVMSGHPGWPRVTREITAHPTEPRTAYLATSFFGQDQVRRTNDAGQTWEVLDGNLPDLPVNVVVADVRCDTPVLLAGTDAGVYRSINDGMNWYEFGQFPHVPVIDLIVEVEGGRERLVAATQGRGAWRTPLPAECWCRADQNGNGTLSNDDFFAYLTAYAAGNLKGADLTGAALAGVPGYGVPNGVINSDDFFYFLLLFVQGC